MPQYSDFAMKTIILLLFCTTFLIQINSSSIPPVADDHHVPPVHVNRHLSSNNGDGLATEPWLKFENPRLKNAYIALQAWKQVILSDPNNMTSNWVGPDLCNYTGVFCWTAPDNLCERTVAGIDINHANIAGHLPHELGLLYDIALFHINTNRFCGSIPSSFSNWKLMYELDLSNNRFSGVFPEMVLHLPSLRYLDIRYNEFEGELPEEVFDRNYDAIFVNNNRFSSAVPHNIGNSPASVIVLANNRFEGCFPAIVGKNRETLNEFILTNNGFSSCLPYEIGLLKNLTVLDVSNNRIMGTLPYSIGDMESLEQINIGHNIMSGNIFQRICRLPNLKSFRYDDNFFSDESPACLEVKVFDDGMNCFKRRPKQRRTLECRRFLSKHLECGSFQCGNYLPPIPFPTPPSFHTPPPPPNAYSPPLQPKTPPPPSNCTCQTAPTTSQTQTNV